MVSAVMDLYGDEWSRRTAVPPQPPVTYPTPIIYPSIVIPSVTFPGFPESPVPAPSPITPQEIEEFRKLLDRAREYDRRRGDENCELDEKRQRLKRLAEELGVEIAFV